MSLEEGAEKGALEPQGRLEDADNVPMEWPALSMRRLRTPRLGVLVVAIGLLVSVPGPAHAQNQTGDMVSYALEFPVRGENHFRDTFWAARSHGIHHATDIMAAKGTPVVAAASGTIRYLNWSTRADNLNPDRCCSLVIKHDDGWETWYLHLNNDTAGTDDGQGWGIADGILPGTHVDAGQLVAWVGDSGNAEGASPHLHFELRDPSGVIVNPYEALRTAAEAAPPVDGDPLFDSARVLRKGDRGDDVERLQEVLGQLDFSPGPVDGIFGPATLGAVLAFQERYGLAADGLVGSATRATLQGLLSSSGETLRLASRGPEVMLLQDLLNGRGYDPGPIDGIFGPLTLDAVLAFQSDEGLTIDGLVGPQTRSALGMM